jgi:protein-L-isoaspartate(D-aspartate) O-methyltransferase
MMVDTQVRPSDVTKFPIIDAMLSLPREVFVPDALREAAYIGENLDLGSGRVMLEPRTLAKMLDALQIDPQDVVLDLGCGLGYATALMAQLADFVVGVEDDPDLASEAETLLAEQGVHNAAVMSGPVTEGAAKSGPYDIIITQGAVEEVPPAILDQLREGGRIACIFAESALGVVRIGHKIDGAVTWRYAFNASAPVLKGFETAKNFAL